MSGTHGSKIGEKTDVVISLVKSGLSQGEIVRQTGWNHSTVGGIIQRARKRGDVPMPKLRPGITSAPCGRVRRTLERQDVHFLKWLIDATPEGCTLVDTLIAIAIDAYAEESTGG